MIANARKMLFATALWQMWAVAAFAADTNTIPKAFTAYAGGHLSTCYTVELREGVLHYSKTNCPGKEFARFTPRAAEWREFRAKLDSLNVWNWHTKYPDPGVYDGMQWSLHIEYGDHALKAEGSNNVPDSTGKPSGGLETKAFDEYCAAVRSLLGGRDFR